MRKHFLLLFLMALLPLAGWAVDNGPLTGYTATFAPMTYNGGEQTLPVPTQLTNGTTNIASSAIQTRDWKNAAGESVDKITNAGMYTCTIQAENYTGTITGVLEVAKFQVNVTAKAIPTSTTKIYFGETLENVKAKFDVTFSTKPSALTDAQWTTQVNAFKEELGFETNYEQWKDLSTAFTYTPGITAMQAKFTNYTFQPIPANITVTAKNLKDNMWTIENHVYDGLDYRPNAASKTLTLMDKERGKAMTENTDYTIAYYGALNDEGNNISGDELTTTGALKNVKDYYVKITGKGNYSTSSFVIAPFKVTQRGLAITTTDQSITYGGAANVPALTADDYEGFQNSESLSTTGLFANGVEKILTKIQKDGADVTATYPNAGTYTVVAYPAKQVTPATDPVTYEPVLVGADGIFNNYKAIFFNIGEYTVKQKEITFTAKPQTKTTGVPSPLDNAAGVQITADNATTYLTALPTLVTAAGDTWKTYPIVKVQGNKVVVDVTNVKIVRGTGENEVDVTANYKLKTTDAIFTNAAGTLNVKVKPVKKTYGDTKSLKNENAALELVIVGGSDADIEYAKPRILKAFSISSTSTAATNGVAFPNVGVYDIKYNADALDLGDLADDYTVEPFEATFTIEKRELKQLKVADLTYAVGEAADAYTPNASNVTITMKDGDTYSLTDTDKRILFKEIKFAFAESITGTDDSKIVGTDGKIKTGKENTNAANGVEIAYVNTSNKLSNFTVTTLKAGRLTVSAAATDATYTQFDRNQVDDATTTGVDESFYGKFVVANDKKKIDVTFKNFASPLKAQKWNSLVLPFDITVAKLSQAMGYALVNVINKEATTADNIKFQIEMGTIPANTPFLVKTSEEVDMNEVTFEGVVVKKSATNKPSIALTDKGVTFYGLYIAKSGLTANERTVSNDTWITDNSKATLMPLAAYLETANANARVFVEDIDEDGTTAIKELDMNTMSVKAVDGWYTLNGVKLQGMPTEKGIYINNGKKVVIK